MADGLLEKIWDKVKDGAITAGEAISEFATEFGKGVKEKGFIQWGIIEPLVHALGMLSDGVDQGIRRLMPRVFDQADKLASHAEGESLYEVLKNGLASYAKALGLPEETQELFKSALFVPENINPIARTILLALTYLQLTGIYTDYHRSRFAHDIAYAQRPNLPDPGSVLGARGLDPDLDERIWEILERNGLKKKDIEVMFAATYGRIPEGRLREIYYRTHLSKEWALHRLHESGVTPERAEELLSTWPVIPGIQDLIMMQAHEAFEPDLIAKYGLGAEAPSEIYEYTRAQGLSDEWTDRYWAAHWQHASYAQVMEMLHRGYIDEATVYDWYKLIEIPPYWRDLLTKIAYRPYTRVDVRRMHDMGVLGDDALVQAMKDIGYDSEHAEKMAEFYKIYNTRSGKELSRSDIEKAYEDRDLSYTEAISLLMSIGYEEAIAEFYISRVELEMQRAARLERIQLTKEKYLSNLISEADARNYLVGYGVVIGRINELIERWNVQRIRNAKLPSKTDLDKFVRAKVLDKDGYTVEMTKLGYSDYYISLYWKYLEAGGAVE